MGLFACFCASGDVAPDSEAPDRSQSTNLAGDPPLECLEVVAHVSEEQVAVAVVKAEEPREEPAQLSAKNAEVLKALLPHVSDCGTLGRLLGVNHATAASVRSWSEAATTGEQVPAGDSFFALCHRCKECSVTLLDTAAPAPEPSVEGDATAFAPPPAAPRCFPGELVCNGCGTSRTGYGRISRAAALHEHGLSESQAGRLRFIWAKPGGGGGRVALVLERDVFAVKADIEREFHLALEAAEAALGDVSAAAAASLLSPRMPDTASAAACDAASEDDVLAAASPSGPAVPHYASPRQQRVEAPPSPTYVSPRQRGGVHAAAAAALGGDGGTALPPLSGAPALLATLTPSQELAAQRLVEMVCGRTAVLADLLRAEIRSKGRYELAIPQAADYVAQAVHFALRRALLSSPVAIMLRRLHPYASAGCLLWPAAPAADGSSAAAPLTPPRPSTAAAAATVPIHVLVERALSAAVAHYERLKPQMVKDAVMIAKRSGSTLATGRRPEALGLEAYRRFRACALDFATELGNKQADRMLERLDEHLRTNGSPGGGALPALLHGSASPGRRPMSPRRGASHVSSGMAAALRRSGGWNNSGAMGTVVVVRAGGTPRSGGKGAPAADGRDDVSLGKWGASPVKAAPVGRHAAHAPSS